MRKLAFLCLLLGAISATRASAVPVISFGGDGQFGPATVGQFVNSSIAIFANNFYMNNGGSYAFFQDLNGLTIFNGDDAEGFHTRLDMLPISKLYFPGGIISSDGHVTNDWRLIYYDPDWSSNGKQAYFQYLFDGADHFFLYGHSTESVKLRLNAGIDQKAQYQLRAYKQVNPAPAPLTAYGGALVLDTTGEAKLSLAAPYMDINLAPRADGFVEIAGALRIKDITPPAMPSSSSEGYIYYDGGSMKAVDQTHNTSVFSPHVPPAVHNPSAISSFEDPTIAYPFSFNHENALLGIGQTVDMAKMVAFVEKKMQAELGPDAGRLVFSYELPADRKITVDEWKAAAIKAQTETAMERLKSEPWVKVELGPDGRVPDEAFEEVDEYKDVEEEIARTEKVLDTESRRIVEKKITEPVTRRVRTGKRITQLKSSYEFRDGDLYRMPSVEDMDAKALMDDTAALPEWLLMRLPSNASLAEIKEEINASVIANLKAAAARVVVSK